MDYSPIIAHLQAEVAELQAAIRVLGRLNGSHESAPASAIPAQPRPKSAGAVNGKRACRECGVTKRWPLDFPKSGSTRCKPCTNAYQRRWRGDAQSGGGPLPWKCDEQDCGKRFSTRDALADHMATEHGDE